MKNLIHLACAIIFIIATISCGHKYYKAADFEERTIDHRLAAVIPAEIILTGKQPKDLTTEQIAEIEEEESLSFQMALYHSILRHANTNKFITTINFQDIYETQRLMKDKGISVRDSWKMSDRELGEALGVDVVIKMRVQKQRYLSDHASYGITVAKQVVYNTGIGSKLPMPGISNKTNDIYASCNLIKEGQALWNDNYKSASDYNSPANVIIEGITDNFGKNFPYKKKR